MYGEDLRGCEHSRVTYAVGAPIAGRATDVLRRRRHRRSLKDGEGGDTRERRIKRRQESGR